MYKLNIIEDQINKILKIYELEEAGVNAGRPGEARKEILKLIAQAREDGKKEAMETKNDL